MTSRSSFFSKKNDNSKEKSPISQEESTINKVNYKMIALNTIKVMPLSTLKEKNPSILVDNSESIDKIVLENNNEKEIQRKSESLIKFEKGNSPQIKNIRMSVFQNLTQKNNNMKKIINIANSEETEIEKMSPLQSSQSIAGNPDFMRTKFDKVNNSSNEKEILVKKEIIDKQEDTVGVNITEIGTLERKEESSKNDTKKSKIKLKEENEQEEEQEEFENCKILYDGLKNKYFLHKYFLIVDVCRQMLVLIIISMTVFSPFLKILFVFLIQLIYLTIAYKAKPFSQKFDIGKFIITEIMATSLLMQFLILSFFDLLNNENLNQRLNLGFSIIIWSLCLKICVLIALIIKSIKEEIEEYNAKKKSDYKKSKAF